MHKKLLVLMSAAALVAGCGREVDVGDAKALHGGEQKIGNVSWMPEFAKSDWQYFHLIQRRRKDSLLNTCMDVASGERRLEASTGWLASEMLDSAWAKRKAALVMGRCEFMYDFNNYINFDGVSSLIYNVSYLFSVPHKALTGLRCSDGIFGWAFDLGRLAVGAVLSIIGIPCATVVGAVCHPVETLANVLGVAYFGRGWWIYFSHTNIVASLWDLLWGGVVYPLWQALVFWL